MTPPLASISDDERAIDQLVRSFFDLFSNRNGVTPDLRAIFQLCVPEAVIAKCVTPTPEVSNLEAFIAPRELLLSNGTVTDFHEVETAARTSILGNIAQRVCTYSKSGRLNGAPFQTRGVKIFQFIKAANGWRIFAVAWDDERDGLAIDQQLLERAGIPGERTAGDPA